MGLDCKRSAVGEEPLAARQAAVLQGERQAVVRAEFEDVGCRMVIGRAGGLGDNAIGLAVALRRVWRGEESGEEEFLQPGEMGADLG